MTSKDAQQPQTHTALMQQGLPDSLVSGKSVLVQHKARLAWQPQAQDIVTLCAALLFLVVSLFVPGRVEPGSSPYEPAWGFLLVALVSFLAGFWKPKIALLAFFRLFYPQLVFAYFFTHSILFSAHLMGGYLWDWFFAAIEMQIFGFQPALALYGTLGSHAWANELMFGVYFFYFVMLVCTPWIAWFSGRKPEARRHLAITSALIFALAAFYLVFRVEGPKYFFPQLAKSWYWQVNGGPFVAFAQNIFGQAVLSGAAFPSTHAALTTASIIGAFRYCKNWIWLWIVIGALIIISIVYIYAHYAVDAIGGIAIGAFAYPLLGRIYDNQAWRFSTKEEQQTLKT